MERGGWSGERVREDGSERGGGEGEGGGEGVISVFQL